METADAVVIGAGFGGLGAGLTLAEQGQRVVVFEALKYPGGCASTFEKGGARYETGATLFSGLDESGLFGRWRKIHDLDVEFVFPDPAVVLRTPDYTLPVCGDRDRFVDQLCAFQDAPAAGIRAFFAEQGRVADALWPVLDDADRILPFGEGGLAWHLGRSLSYLPLLRQVGRPALRAMERHGVADFRPLRTWVDALCQITVQADAATAEAPFALSTLDYAFRGTGHVHGGIGKLATALGSAIGRAGGEVVLPSRVRGIERDGDHWVVHARNRRVRCRNVVSNVLPQVLGQLLGDLAPDRRLQPVAARVEGGWTACMLYLRLAPTADLRPEPFHLELVADEGSPFVEGNHIFVSVSGSDEDRAPGGERTATVSTHVAPHRLQADPGRVTARVQARMDQTLRTLAPEVAGAVVHRMTASPRTWQRFTGRPGGLVGGVPRTVGLHHYWGLWPRPVLPGLWMVGDSVFPGQSTLATALGGAATARSVLAA